MNNYTKAKTNKYIEALDRTDSLINYLSLFHETEPFYEEWSDDDKKVLEELVDRATPKKPEYEGDSYYKGEIVYDTWICPNCGERYEVDYHDYDYCPKCGQALDWSEYDEDE